MSHQTLRIHQRLGRYQVQEYDENDLIDSELNQTYTKNGKSVEIHIYRMPNTSWILEVVDSFGNSTVFDDEFATDSEALSYVIDEIERDGIEGFIGSAN
jgi:hypothetical protein